MSSGDRTIKTIELQGTLDLILPRALSTGARGRTELAGEAKFSSLTHAGERALAEQAERWRRRAGLVGKLRLEN